LPIKKTNKNEKDLLTFETIVFSIIPGGVESMKLRLLAISFLAMAGMAGCSSMPQAEKKEEPKIEHVEVSEEEYPERIHELNLSMDEGFKNLNTVSNEDPSSKNRTERMNEQIDAIQKTVNNYKAIIAPEKYKEVHDQYLSAMKFYDEGLDTIRKAIEEQDSELWQKGNEPIKEGYTIWAEAHTQLNDLLPVGDGTITNKDLKELDALAGIDRDSVIKNISEDGKELVGKWGAPGSTPSIILNADGSYEGYANGTYPSKDNMFKGTWKFDYQKRGLFFTHDESYNAGKKATDFRKSMTMEVQSFKDGNLQLMDIETLNTFNYVKMD
jgi:hypothetical protein